MKRKLFSAILFGACLVASTSGLTSCKDYDDDISNLQSQIDKLATKEELQEKAKNLEDKINAAQSSADNALEVAKAAQKAADAAATSGDVDAAKKAAIDAANQAVADLKKELEGSLASKQELEQAAKAAEKVVTDLQSSLVGDSGLTIDQVMAIVNDAVSKVNDDKTGLDALEARLAAVESKLTPEGSEEEIDLTEIQEELDLIEAALIELVGDVQNMPTSIELVKNYMYNQDNVRMNFTLFEEQKNEFGKDYLASPVNFTKGATKFNSSSVLIRVNPVNADITNKVNNISLINSQGKEISDIVKVKSVSRFNGTLETWGATGPYTRSVDQTGLWVVEFEPVEGKSAKELKDAFVTEYFWGHQTAQQWRYINYAVSLNNVAGADTLNTSFDETRRLVTAYDVTMDYKKANSYDADPYWENHGKFISHTPGPGDTWTAWNEPINIIPLSFTTSAGTEYIKQVNNRASDLVWMKSYTGTDANGDDVDVVTPAVNVTKSTDDGHAQDYNSFTDDSRRGRNIVAKVGERIYIDFNKTNGTQTMPIKGFFVVLDGKNAESTSAPSEINAWNSYVYENVGKVDSDAKLLTINNVKQYSTFQNGNSGYIVVKDLYGEATGDEIGFRVYAVNLDGTLVDPDGLAFYVTVGESGNNVALGAKNVLVDDETSNTSEAYSFTKGIIDAYSWVEWSLSLGNTKINQYDYDNQGNLTATNFEVEYHVNGASAPNDWVSPYSGDRTKYDGVRIIITKPTLLTDNATYTVNADVKKIATGTAYTKFTMTGSLTKVMPTTPPLFVFNVEQYPEQVVLPGAALSDLVVTGTAKIGALDFNNMFIKSDNHSIASDSKYVFTLANSKYKTENGQEKIVDLVTPYDAGATAPNFYQTSIDPRFIDCKTAHALTSAYNYGQISSVRKADNSGYEDYKRETSSYSLTYYTWSYIGTGYMNYAWKVENITNSAGEVTGTRTYNSVTIERTDGANPTYDLVNVSAKPGAKINSGLRKSTLKNYLTDGWLVIDEIHVTAKNSAGNEIVDPYYTASESAGVITFTKKNDVANVPAHTGTLKITAHDCYHYKQTIVLENIKFVR